MTDVLLFAVAAIGLALLVVGALNLYVFVERRRLATTTGRLLELVLRETRAIRRAVGEPPPPFGMPPPTTDPIGTTDPAAADEVTQPHPRFHGVIDHPFEGRDRHDGCSHDGCGLPWELHPPPP